MLSIIIPFYNEKDSLPILQKKIESVCGRIKGGYELIFVDDGSTDGSCRSLKKDRVTRFVVHRKRYGKGKALASGIDAAQGDTIVFMDADLQDDPNDIPTLLHKLENGYDFVNGARVKRKDGVLVKTYSFFANRFLKSFLKSPFTDVNCPFKVFRRKVLAEYIFYGNNFRFFPLAVYYQGYKVAEMPVSNHPREYGVSKFGSSKLFGGVFDTLTAYFIFKFSEKPLQFFGPIGGLLLLAGTLIVCILAVERIFFNMLLYRRPLLLYGILCIIVGVQIIMTGIIGELIVYLHKKNNSS